MKILEILDGLWQRLDEDDELTDSEKEEIYLAFITSDKEELNEN